MKRRSFLKIAATTAGAVLLPSVGAADLTWNVNRLNNELESMFRCHLYGPPSYEPGPSLTLKGVTHEYVTYALKFIGGNAVAAEARLSKALYDVFKPDAGWLVKRDLFWRVKFQFSTYEHVVYGERWASWEDVQDGVKTLADKPVDVVQNIDNGAYYYVANKEAAHVVRGRLFIPRQHLSAGKYEKPEGLPALQLA